MRSGFRIDEDSRDAKMRELISVEAPVHLRFSLCPAA